MQSKPTSADANTMFFLRLSIRPHGCARSTYRIVVRTKFRLWSEESACPLSVKQFGLSDTAADTPREANYSPVSYPKGESPTGRLKSAVTP